MPTQVAQRATLNDNVHASMTSKTQAKVRDGARCQVIGGTHVGKSGIVRDVNMSKTGHVTITVVQANGERFKTLAKNVVVRA
jgi:ribosomal protein S4E